MGVHPIHFPRLSPFSMCSSSTIANGSSNFISIFFIETILPLVKNITKENLIVSSDDYLLSYNYHRKGGYNHTSGLKDQYGLPWHKTKIGQCFHCYKKVNCLSMRASEVPTIASYWPLSVSTSCNQMFCTNSIVGTLFCLNSRERRVVHRFHCTILDKSSHKSCIYFSLPLKAFKS